MVAADDLRRRDGELCSQAAAKLSREVRHRLDLCDPAPEDPRKNLTRAKRLVATCREGGFKGWAIQLGEIDSLAQLYLLGFQRLVLSDLSAPSTTSAPAVARGACRAGLRRAIV